MLSTILVGSGLAVLVALIVRKLIRDARQGKGSCGGDCSRCRGCH